MPRAVRALGSALVLPWRAGRGTFLGQLLVAVQTGLAPVLAAWLLREVFDGLTGSGPRSGLLILVLALAATGGLAGMLPNLSQYLTAQSSRAVERHATSELFTAVGRLTGLRKLEDPGYLDRLNVAQHAGMSGPAQILVTLTGTVQSAVTLAGFLITLLVLSPVLGTVVVVAALPGIAAQFGIARQRAKLMNGLSQAQRRQYFYAGLLTTAAAAKEIRLFGLGAFFRRRMLSELGVIQQENQRVDRRQFAACTLLQALSALVAGFGMWWAISAAARGSLTVGDVSVFIAALAAVGSSLAGVVGSAALMYQAALMFDAYQDIVTGSQDLPVPAKPVPAQPLRQGIELHDVWFRYAPDQPWALRGLSFAIPAGQALALVGRNGAGKSTLVKLLCRFYDPERGRILWDGVDLRDMDPSALRNRISTVFQDYMSYELSARENIAVGDLSLGPAGEVDPGDAVAEAAARAGIHDKLRALPNGYDTLLTRSYVDLADKEDPRTGVLLSGGQWQRVALARALLRGGRDLMILDEPSSGLDAEAEYEIHHRLRDHRGDRTTVLISHRLNAVRDADHIVVLVDGAVAERGDHELLMSAGGTYARLFGLQAKGFATAGVVAVDG